MGADGRGTATKIPDDKRLPVVPFLAVTCEAADEGTDKRSETWLILFLVPGERLTPAGKMGAR